MCQIYPGADETRIDDQIENEMTVLQQAIGAIRNIRGEMNVPPSKDAELVLMSAHSAHVQIIQQNEIYFKKLAKLNHISYNSDKPKLAASAVVQSLELYMPLAELIDVKVEKNRIEKEIARLEQQLFNLQKKMTNREFLARAPGEVIEKERQKKLSYEENLEKLENILHVLET